MRVLQELPQLPARWLITGEESPQQGERPEASNTLSTQDQGRLAYAVAHGESSSASANISMCHQLDACLQLLQERDQQLKEKDNQIQQLHQMLQILLTKGS